jgi:LysR family transcriptional regulator, transcriptional activator of the cysJI operon
VTAGSIATWRGPEVWQFPNISSINQYYAIEIYLIDNITYSYAIVPDVIFGDCKLFRDVAHARSLSKAASMNGISQSAATQHIQELERRLGVQLLDRSTRPLGLTAGGKLYAELCRDILRREEDFIASLDEIKAEAEGTIRVASIYSIGLTEMSRLRDEFARICPGANLHIEYLRPDKVYEAVIEGHADLGFISYPEHRRDLTVIPWREERMTVALYPTHPLADRDLLLPQDLDRQDFIAFDEEVIIRRELDRFFREHGVVINMVMQFDNIQSIKEAVALGSGISILPERTILAEVDQGRLVSIPLHAPELVRPTGIIHRKKKKLTRAGRQFMGLVVANEEQPDPELVGMS